MHSYFFFPPLPKLSGGMAVIVDMARHLHDAGYPVSLITREQAPALKDRSGGVPIIPWEALQITANDLWLVPEGWPNALAPGLQAGARCVLYVQNWAYLHGNLPQNVHWANLAVDFLAVSHPVAWFVQHTTGQCPAKPLPPILRPGIDSVLFHPPRRDLAQAASDPVRVAWMPRKNKALAGYIRTIFEARNPEPLEWVEIHNKTPDQVAELLRSCHIFLATGFPEGCPLPPLEALASGCLVTGFSGFGGWDYMRQALPAGFPGAFTPWWPQRPEHETPWGGNGLYVADADVVAAASALEYGVTLVRQGGAPLADIRQAAADTVARYTLLTQKQHALALWESWVN